MNKEVLESQWMQIRDILKEKFSNLTEEDIRQINGQYDQLVDKLQQKYGYSHQEAEERIRNWNFDRFATHSRDTVARENKPYREEIRKNEDNSALKWLLGIGIPLLLLGAYFFSTTADRTATPTYTNQTAEQTVANTSAADRILSTNIRNSLISEYNLDPSTLQNLQITTQNGIVTLSGNVPSQEISNVIANTARNQTGVKQVINNLRIQ